LYLVSAVAAISREWSECDIDSLSFDLSFPDLQQKTNHSDSGCRKGLPYSCQVVVHGKQRLIRSRAVILSFQM
jgi:hypothetical protein